MQKKLVKLSPDYIVAKNLNVFFLSECLTIAKKQTNLVLNFEKKYSFDVMNKLHGSVGPLKLLLSKFQ